MLITFVVGFDHEPGEEREIVGMLIPTKEEVQHFRLRLLDEEQHTSSGKNLAMQHSKTYGPKFATSIGIAKNMSKGY